MRKSRAALVVLWAVCLVVQLAGARESLSDQPAEKPQNTEKQIETLMNLGMAYGESKRWQPAIERFKQVLELDAQFAPAHFGLGRVYYEMKRYPEAETELLAAVRLRPGYVDAHVILSYVEEKLGDMKGAIAHAEQAITVIKERKGWVEEEVRAGRLERDDSKLLRHLEKHLSKLRARSGRPGATP